VALLVNLNQERIRQLMSKGKKNDPMVSSTEQSQVTNFLGVKYSVLLPREKSECVEILLQRFPKGLSFPIHQHKECEQTYIVLEGEGEVTVADQVKRITKDDVVYIPRLTDHRVRNVGDGDFVYLTVETYPDGYLPNEPTWDSHIAALNKHYGLTSEA
jgi:quercetin dioxygenase-like cupin family protein